MIDQQEMFWFDRAACLANRLGEGALLQAGQFSRTMIDGHRPSVTKELLQHLKDLPDASRKAQMEEIDQQLRNCMPGTLELAPHYPLNWQQICIMSEAGMEIGSHSHSHPILSQLEDSAAVEAELITSRAIIEAKTSKDCIVIAYPEGLDYAIDARVIAACEAAGYSLGLTSMRGVNKLPIGRPYQLERIQIHHSNDQEIFIGSLQFPEIVV
jgi:peptidoglycan/xylan/chitin deacetylase (PgdA/CDA1 family)